MHAVNVICGTLLALLAVEPAPRTASLVVEIEAGKYDRQGTPVLFTLPTELAGNLGPEGVVQARSDEGTSVPVQVLTCPDAPTRLAWILEAKLPAGTVRRYTIELNPRPSPAKPSVNCSNDGKELKLAVQGRPVLTYHEAMVEAPPGLPPYFRRNGQIHPVFTPSGKVVTDDFPPDHAHQHAVFFAWVNTTFQGRHLDFWNQKEQTGGISHVATLETRSGPVFGQFRVELRHDDLTTPGEPRPVLDEVWTVRAYNLADVFLIDFESRQMCVASDPLILNQYRYGGMGVRGNRDWFDPTVKGDNPPDPARSGASNFLTSEGKDRSNGNHTRPTWCDLSGRIGGESFGGIALLDHPQNFLFPQPVRLHPTKPYFCFAPMVLKTFEIAPGKPYVSRYRMAVHDGPADPVTIDRLWRDYGEPPRVKVVATQ